MPTLTVGLTGGVASGKSLVSGFFVRLGAPVLDADEVARSVVEPGTAALQEIAERFGPSVIQPDGRLHRRKLREKVFHDPVARRELERITHPAIGRELLRWRDAQERPYCILSIAILIEAGMQALVDRILVVDVPSELQLERLQRRDGVTAELAEQMLAAQVSREQRLAAAHDVLRNTGSPDEAHKAVETLHRFYLDLAASGDIRAPGLCLPMEGH